eukprot:TRINITY_DN18072_c0_g1_i3.p1 TRINITY_DN18072_c0_g1~~TRINITY_DN18072_c0_g1_i3.p1  ORF type:complete len:178 (-),score=18.59 TRINITY_DN18072_c0_g1_i3:303-836(-)
MEPNKMGRAFFCFSKILQEHQKLAVIGDDPALGNWDINKGGVILEHSSNNLYCGSIMLPIECKYEYKFAIVSEDFPRKLIEMDSGPSRVLHHTATELKVITFNIAKDEDEGTVNAWPNRRPHLKKFFAEINADIIGMQECSIKMYKNLEADLESEYSGVFFSPRWKKGRGRSNLLQN